MIFDSHVHTVLSCDSDTTIVGAIRTAEFDALFAGCSGGTSFWS